MGTNDEGETILYMTREEKLSPGEAAQILKDIDRTKLSTRPPFRPTGGQIFVYSADFNKRDLTLDGYRWSYKGGYCGYPRHNSANMVVLKLCKRLLTPEKRKYGDERFRVQLYKLPVTGPTETLVHYIGDAGIFVPMPHARDKKNVVADWFPTSHSVLSMMRAEPEASPTALLKDLEARPIATEHPCFRPRNVKQIQNQRAILRRSQHKTAQDHIYVTNAREADDAQMDLGDDGASDDRDNSPVRNQPLSSPVTNKRARLSNTDLRDAFYRLRGDMRNGPRILLPAHHRAVGSTLRNEPLNATIDDTDEPEESAPLPILDTTPYRQDYPSNHAIFGNLVARVLDNMPKEGRSEALGSLLQWIHKYECYSTNGAGNSTI